MWSCRGRAPRGASESRLAPSRTVSHRIIIVSSSSLASYHPSGQLAGRTTSEGQVRSRILTAGTPQRGMADACHAPSTDPPRMRRFRTTGSPVHSAPSGGMVRGHTPAGTRRVTSHGTAWHSCTSPPTQNLLCVPLKPRVVRLYSCTDCSTN